MYHKLNVELPAGYTASTSYGRRTPEIAVELYWQSGWLATALLEVEMQSFNPADDPETEVTYANGREFARRCAAIHSVIRECLCDDGLDDTESGMALSWLYRAAEDDDDRLEVEFRQKEVLVLEKSYPLPPAVRDFDEAPKDAGALTRTALRPVLDDWWRLRGGATAFSGTEEEVS